MSIKAILGGGCALAALVCCSWPSHAQTTYNTSQTVSAQITHGPVTVTGGSTVLFTNAANNYSGGTTVNDASTLQVTVDGNMGNASGAVTLGDGTYNGTLNLSASTAAVTSARNFTIDAGGGTIQTGTGGTWTLNGAISGAGALTVGGNGNLILGGSSGGYAGGVNLTGGTLSVTSNANLGSGTVALSAGTTLNFTATNSFANAAILTGDPTFNVVAPAVVTYSGVIADGTSPGTLNLTGGGTLNLTAVNTYSGGTLVSGGSTLAVGADTALGNANGTLSLGNGSTAGTLDTTSTTGAVTSTRNVYVSAPGGTILVGPGGTWTLNGVVYGNGALTVTNASNLGGELVLGNASNSFFGLNVLGNAAVQAATDGDLGNVGVAVTLGGATSGSGTGTLDFTTATAAVTSNRLITLNPGGGIFLSNSNTNVWNLQGVISGTGGMTLNGGGTLILTGTNTFNGNTTVIGGSTLQIYADSNLGVLSNGLTTGMTVFLGNASSSGTLSLNGTQTSQRTITLGSDGGTVETASGSTWTFANPVGGTGPLTVGGTGTLVLDAANTYTGGTVIAGGTLMVGGAGFTGASIGGPVTLTGGTLTGYGTINGNVTNTGGTVATGGGLVAPLTINGNYSSNGGTTAIALTPAGASLLSVSGNVNLTGTTLVLNFNGNFSSETIQLIKAGSITCGAVSNTCVTWNPNALSASMQETLVFTGTTVDLTLLQLALPANNVPTIYPEITTVAIDQSQAANDTILTRLTDLRTEAVADDMPMADTRLHRPGLSAGRSPYGAWMKALGGFGSTSGSDAPSYDTHGEGFIMGVDTPVGTSAIAGLAFEYGVSSIAESGGASAKLDTPRLMAYGGWWHGLIALDGTLGYGRASISSSRPISGTGDTAAATAIGNEYTAAFQASTPTHWRRIAVTPAIGVDYARLSQSLATEGGASPYNLSILQNTTNSLRPFVATTVSTRFDWGAGNAAVEPQLRVAYQEEMIHTSRQSLVQPVGDSQVFTVPGVAPSNGTLLASAGLKIETGRSFAFALNADATEAGNFHGYGGDASFRWRF